MIQQPRIYYDHPLEDESPQHSIITLSLDHEEDLISHKYYVGTCFLDNNNFFLMENIIVELTQLYLFSYKQWLNFLLMDSLSFPNWRRLEIMKLEIVYYPNCVFPFYTVILKTHYLRLVQRRWKKIFRERQRILQDTRKVYQYLTQRSLGGKKKLFSK